MSKRTAEEALRGEVEDATKDLEREEQRVLDLKAVVAQAKVRLETAITVRDATVARVARAEAALKALVPEAVEAVEAVEEGPTDASA